MRIELVKELIMEFGVKNVYYNEKFGEVQIGSIVYKAKNAKLVNNCLELFDPEFGATAIIGYNGVRTEFVEGSNMDCVLKFLNRNNIEHSKYSSSIVIDLDEDLIIVDNGGYRFETEQCKVDQGINDVYIEDKDGYILYIYDDGGYMIVDPNNEIELVSIRIIKDLNELRR